MKALFIRVVHERDCIKEDASHWRETYQRPIMMRWGTKNNNTITRLDLLDLEACTTPELNDALGFPDGDWGKLFCDSCGDQQKVVLRLGDEPEESEAHWLFLCQKCLRKGLKLLENRKAACT